MAEIKEITVPRSWITFLLVVVFAVAGLAGCAKTEATTTAKSPPAQIEPIEGTSSKRIVLVPEAVKRLDLKTEPVRAATPQEMAGVVPPGQGGRTAVPFDAVLYDKTGAPFLYTSPKDLEYVRQPVTLDGVRNKVAVLSAGPPVGTLVVTVGGIELYGVETGVGK